MFARMFIAAIVLPVLLVGANPNPIAYGPGDSYKEGRGCAARWDPDTTSNIAQVAPNSGICIYDDRAYDFLDESNRVAADLGLGVPPEEETVPAAAKPADTLDERDLIARLINDNKALWDRLLRNHFCQEHMKTQPATDQTTLDGFKWYMRQDFLYVAKLPTYEAHRGLKATNTKDFEISMDRVGKRAIYAKDILKVCTTAPPNGLGIEESTVFATPETGALQQYVALLLDAADKENWVMSAVATTPCIQSYYMIAVDLYKNSVHKDTPWYKLWTEENVKYKGSTERQKTFFKENYDQWKNHYAEANEIFQKACQAELNFWDIALSPGAR